MKNLLRAAVFTAGSVFFVLPSVAAEIQTPQITVTGNGQVSVRPDMAVVVFGVQKVGPTARQALDENNNAMKKVIALLKEAGIEEKKIKTSGFSIQPQFDYRNNSSRPAEIIGYQVRNSVTVEVGDLSLLGSLLDKAVDAGLNEGGQISFTNQDIKTLMRQAEAKAVKDAIEKAQLMAEAAGVKTGRIISIQESGGSMPVGPMVKRLAFDAEASSVPIENGENTYQANVTVTVEIQSQ